MSETETAQSNEERVRGVWECAHIGRWGSQFTVLRVLGFDEWHSTIDGAWAAAWEYTEAALEEARQLREDVTRTEDIFVNEHHRLRLEMEPWWSEDDPPYKPTKEDFAAMGDCVVYWVRRICSTVRILARLQSLLSAKSAGMKPESA